MKLRFLKLLDFYISELSLFSLISRWALGLCRTSEHKIEYENEAQKHSCNDNVGPPASVSGDFFKSGGTHLE